MANVLYDATLWWRWLAQLLARLHPSVDCKQLSQEWHSSYLSEVRCGRREFSEVFEAFLNHAGLPRGEVDEILAAGLSRRRDLEFEVFPYPGVKPTLQRLHQAGVPMAIISDSTNTSDELIERLARLGLAGYFDHVLSSVEVGAIKPAAICYESILSRLQIDRNRVWFIGHSEDELHGAAQCGLKTIGHNAPANIVCDGRVSRFETLLELFTPEPIRATA
jgi:HAD superfamily hydrolase (TIGR01509 family)